MSTPSRQPEAETPPVSSGRRGLATEPRRRVAVLAGARATDALEPLLIAYAQRCDVLPIKPSWATGADWQPIGQHVDAILHVGSRLKSPRTAVPGAAIEIGGGRRIPLGWLPDVSWDSVRRFALAAASVHGRSDRLSPRRTIALLGQRSRRYGSLAARIEVLLEVGNGVRVQRWTADELVRDDLVEGLGLGVSAAIYVGHGRPIGWAAYGGIRAIHLTRLREPAGAVLSLTCLTASRRRTSMSFCEALPLQGATAACVGAVATTSHLANARWALRVSDVLGQRGLTIGDLVVQAAAADSAASAYRLLGDPLAPLIDAPGTAYRARALTAACRLPQS